jgi:predicted dehydrogenase
MYPEGHPVYHPTPEKMRQLNFKGSALDPVPPNGVVYHPFVWRGWREYGTGPIGDGSPHSWNGIMWALDPGPIASVEVLGTSGMTKDQYPDWSAVRFEFVARGGKPGLKIFHYDGGKKMPKEVSGGQDVGTVWIGTKGSNPQGYGPFLGQKAEPYPVPPEKDWGRVEVHKDFTNAIRNGGQPPCNFAYAGAYTESYLLGNVALKAGKRIEWDSEAFKITNDREANKYLFREYRKGWDMKEIAGSKAFNV